MHIAVIGGGPGGYVAAIRAAQLGARVTLIEKNKLGGTCLNWGCIPTKVLVHTVELFHDTKNAQEYGLEVPAVEVNWKQLQHRKERVVNQLVEGVEGLLQSWGVEVIRAEASFETQSELELKEASGVTRRLTFDKAIIASGSDVMTPPIKGADHPEILTSTEALSLENIPESLCVIGGGVIGTEFAGIYAGLGTQVTVIEMLPRILMSMDRELTEMVTHLMEEEGVTFHTETQVEHVEKTQTGFRVHASRKGVPIKIETQKLLMAAGRKASTDRLNLANVSIETNKGQVVVDKYMKTTANNVYAIGDCTGGAMLAHVASAQGIYVAETLMGINSEMNLDIVPGCVYIRPEYASVGLTEEAALERGYKVKTGTFSLTGNGKALIMNNGVGVVKFVADKESDELLGLHILGPRATDMISEGALALRLEATLNEIGTTMHPHPTIGEAIFEAAHDAIGHCIHAAKK